MNMLMNPCHANLLVSPARVSNDTPHSGAPVVPPPERAISNMALLVSLVAQILEDILHTDDWINCQLVKNSSCMILSLSAIKKRRDSVPKIYGYAEHVIPTYNMSDFKMHFRISTVTFHKICDLISHLLLSDHSGGQVAVAPEKMILVFLCYLVNQESMREVGHYFGLSKSTVHGCVQKVCKAMLASMRKVCTAEPGI